MPSSSSTLPSQATTAESSTSKRSNYPRAEQSGPTFHVLAILYGLLFATIPMRKVEAPMRPHCCPRNGLGRQDLLARRTVRQRTNSFIGVGARAGALLQNPAGVLTLICLFQFSIWTVAPLAINSGLHVNILSVALWGREWVMLSYKHPNLPCWVFEAAESLF